MIALTAEELSVPLFMLSSIRDIALRFFFEYIMAAQNVYTAACSAGFAFSVLYCFDVYEACIHINVVSRRFCPFIFFFLRSHKESSVFFVVFKSFLNLVRRKPWVAQASFAAAKLQKKNNSQ
jgi:hypothetical protein